jgi:hypothetical protein
MKHPILNLTASSILTFGLAASGPAVFGQTSVQSTTMDQGSVQTTVTSAGTISDFNPDAIVVKTENVDAPVRYTYSKTTTYVDEDGNPVSMETVKSGLPVTVYYVKDGDNLVASKVIVRKAVTPAAVNIQKSTSTTTTTTDK